MDRALADAEAVFFDVDNTLYDFERSMDHAFAHLRRAFPALLGPHGEDALSRAYWAHYRAWPEEEKVRVINSDPDLFRRTMWAGALRNLGVDAGEAARAFEPHAHAEWTPDHVFVRALTAEFQRHRPAHWRAAMYEGAPDVLRGLRARGTTLGAITNGPGNVQRPKLEALSYRDYFDEPLVFVSGEFGVRKPDPSIFLAAAKAAGADPSRCVMVGDAREFDMPAKAVGFRTVLFDGKREAPDCASDPWPPDAVATSYADVARLLGL